MPTKFGGGGGFLEKMIKGSCVYALEFMFTLDKMQNISYLMCEKFKI